MLNFIQLKQLEKLGQLEKFHNLKIGLYSLVFGLAD